METKANYILVGACTLLALLLFAAVLAFNAKDGNKSNLSQYVIYFTGDVSGLSEGNAVLFHGVRIGSIKQISLNEKDQTTVRVLIEVSAQIKMREDCEATLRAVGITGIMAINISGGAPASPLLSAKADMTGEEVPVIPAGTSTIEHLAEAVPELMRSAEALMSRASVMLSPENEKNLAITLASLAKITSDLAGQTEQLATTLDNLNQASLALNKTLNSATNLFDNNIGRTSISARRSFDQLNSILTDLKPEIHRLSNTGMSELSRLLSDTRNLVQSFDRLLRRIDNSPTGFLFGEEVPEYSPD